jgi:hypothetical protein
MMRASEPVVAFLAVALCGRRIFRSRMREAEVEAALRVAIGSDILTRALERECSKPLRSRLVAPRPLRRLDQPERRHGRGLHGARTECPYASRTAKRAFGDPYARLDFGGAGISGRGAKASHGPRYGPTARTPATPSIVVCSTQ